MEINITRQILQEYEPTLTRGEIPSLITKLFPNPSIVELGVFEGNGLDLLLRTNPTKIVGVDLWKGDGKISTTDGLPDHIMQKYYEQVYNTFKDNDKVELVRDTTINASKKYDDNSFDFVFIDGDHTYDGCFNDIVAWYSKVKDGGILSGHDYFEHTSAYKFGVIEAVNDFVNQNTEIGKIYVSNEKVAPCWFIIKVPLIIMNSKKR